MKSLLPLRSRLWPIRATDPDLRAILLQHRELLARFGREHHDPLVAEMLADHVKPVPFTAEDSAPKAAAPRQKKGARNNP